MRNVDRTNITKPIELDSSDCQLHLNAVIATPTLIKVSSDFYKGKKTNPDGSIEYTVRENLKRLYKNKCAYCEKLSSAPKIDHHRPKGKVVSTDSTNIGYYWLCYEWTNLLPSCTDCNSIESKGSKYPINGNRNNLHPIQGNPPVTNSSSFIYNSQFNISEQPLLLHPEYCIPENNFAFDKQGRIIGITTEGVETVYALKLNNRDLNGWRRKIYADYLSDLESKIKLFYTDDNPLTEPQFTKLIANWTKKIVVEANDESLEYTLFRKFLLNYIDYFFISEIDPVFQKETKAKIILAISDI